MQIIDTFSGIGGFSLAGRWMGWRTIQFCEIDKFCQKVLAYHFPGVPIHKDIKTLTAKQIINNGLYDKNEPTIFVGGVPCQPWSQAGKRLGKEDDRDLWEETISLIGEIQPDFAILENVRGLINWNGGVVFDEVQSDLESQGYEVLPFLLPACAVNAPHRRDRIWFVAHRNNSGNTTPKIGTNGNEQKENKEREQPFFKPDRHGTIAYTQSTGTRQNIGRVRSELNGHSEGLQTIEQNDVADSKGIGHEFTWGTRHRREGFTDNGESIIPNSKGGSGKRQLQQGQGQGQGKFGGQDSTNVANSNSGLQSGKEHRQTETGQLTKTSLPGNWQNFPTESPICGRNDGLPTKLDGITFSKWRNESIKGYGNAIVPQVVYQIFKAIESPNYQYHRLTNNK